MKIKHTEQKLKEKIEELEPIIQFYIHSLQDYNDYSKDFKKYNMDKKFFEELKEKSNKILSEMNDLKNSFAEPFFKNVKKFLLHDYGPFVDLLKLLFYQILSYYNKQEAVNILSSKEGFVPTFFGQYYLQLTNNYKEVKNIVNQFFFKDITLKDRLVIDERTELWSINDLQHQIFPSDYYKIRVFTEIITKSVSKVLDKESFTLFIQQTSELIKNAVKHGNKNDMNKKIHVWYGFDGECYKLIIEDEGEGFKDIEKWNEFNQKRNHALLKGDMEKMLELVAYRTENSDEEDGGNALFSALEYWDSGVIFNDKKNKVLVMKYFY